MADNVTIVTGSVGSGVTVLSDELTDGTLGTGQVQFVKFMDGTLNSSNKAKVDSVGRLAVAYSPGVGAGGPALSAVSTFGQLTSPTNVAPTANSFLSLPLDGSQSSTFVSVSGSAWTGSMWVDVTSDSSNYVSVLVTNITTGAVTTGITTPGIYNVTTTGYTGIRARLGVGSATGVFVTLGNGNGVYSPTNLSPNGPPNITAYNRLETSDEPTEVLTDPFDGAVVDTTNRWTNTGTAMTQVSGSLNAATTALTVSGRTSLASKQLFAPQGNAYSVLFGLVKFESGGTPTTNTHRWFGFGTEGSTPTATGTGLVASPIVDGVGLEIDTAQNVWFSVYNTAGRIASASLATYKASLFDGNIHRIKVIKRADRKFLFIDDFTQPVATLSNAILGQQALPILIHTINNSTAPAATPTFAVSVIALADSGRNNIAISDATYAWRQATVPGASTSLSVLTGASNSARTSITFYAQNVAGATIEALITLNKSINGATATTGTTFGASATGKTLRITSVTFSLRNSTAAANAIQAWLRMGSAAATATSPIVSGAQLFTSAATIGASDKITINFPDGIEFTGTQTFGVSQLAVATTANLSVMIAGYEY